MTLLSPVTLDDAFLTISAPMLAVLKSKHPRRDAYFRAWIRRYHAELQAPAQQNAPASACMLALTGRIVTLATEL